MFCCGSRLTDYWNLRYFQDSALDISRSEEMSEADTKPIESVQVGLLIFGDKNDYRKLDGTSSEVRFTGNVSHSLESISLHKLSFKIKKEKRKRTIGFPEPNGIC